MKNLAIGILLLVVIVGFILQLLRIQDAEYQRHSDRAKESCQANPERTLVYDKELEYFKCVK